MGKAKKTPVSKARSGHFEVEVGACTPGELFSSHLTGINMGTSAADADKKLEVKVVQTGANRLLTNG
jgi:hypothetical protein